MPAPAALPSTFPPYAFLATKNYLNSRLRSELNINRKVTLNVPMSLMVHLGEDPEGFLEDPYIKWWISHSTPITAGYTVLDEKLNSGTERDIESVVATERHPQHGTERNVILQSGGHKLMLLLQSSIYEGLADDLYRTRIKFQFSLSSTQLSQEAQDQLVIRHEMDNLSCWSPIACAVLAANDLVRAQVNEPKCYLASILVVALTIWRRATPRFTLDDRKFAWNKTVGLLKAGNSPLLQVLFNNDIRRVCTDLAAIGDDNFHGFDDEVEAREGPGGGYISAAFIEVRSYTPSNGRRNSAGSRSSSPSHKHIRHSSPSSAHSLSKCCFTPQCRSEV